MARSTPLIKSKIVTTKNTFAAASYKGRFFGRIEYMEEEILKKIEAQDKKLKEIYNSIEKMRKYFLWTLIITIAVIILPLIGILVLIPKFLSTLSGSNLGLQNC